MVIWTSLAVLDWTTQRFQAAGIDGARLEAQLLLAHALQCSRTQLYMAFDKPLGDAELASYRDLVRRRLGGEPVAYLVGEHEFWGRPFTVSTDVLIPRNDTETIVELVLVAYPDRQAPLRIADLCTGSGILGVTLALEYPSAQVVATDISPAALAIATRNVERHALTGRVALRPGDLWAAVAQDEVFDLVVSNPPYVVASVIASLQAEVRREPVLALDGGADGLALLRRLLAGAPVHLGAAGRIYVEHGYDQGESVPALARAAGLADVELFQDLGRQPRVTVGRRQD